MKKTQIQNSAICQNTNGIPSQSPRLSPRQNPEGIQPSSPGLRGTSYLGLSTACPSTLKRFRPKGWVVGGYQADMEAGKTYTGILYEERMRGILATRGEKVLLDKDCKKQVTGSVGSSDEIQAALKPSDWNEYVIIAQGNHLQQFINGKQTVDVTDDCESKRAMNGVLALQLHAGPPMKVQFRDLRLRAGSAAKEAAADPLAPFQGTWEIVSVEKDGSALPQDDIGGMTVMISGSAYKLINKDNVSKGTFSLDASKDPKQMDVHHQSESGDDQTMPAIYDVSSDTMRVCYNPEGGTRPTSFSTKPDSPFLAVVYKRKAE